MFHIFPKHLESGMPSPRDMRREDKAGVMGLPKSEFVISRMSPSPPAPYGFDAQPGSPPESVPHLLLHP